MSLPTLRVCTWNILAPSLAMKKWFPEVPHSALEWKNRWKRMQGVFRTLRADVICLQEVEKYSSHVQGFLNSLGYESVYLQKPGKAHGCLICWKTSKLELVRQQPVYLDDAAIALSLLEPTATDASGVVHPLWPATDIDVDIDADDTTGDGTVEGDAVSSGEGTTVVKGGDGSVTLAPVTTTTSTTASTNPKPDATTTVTTTDTTTVGTEPVKCATCNPLGVYSDTDTEAPPGPPMPQHLSEFMARGVALFVTLQHRNTHHQFHVATTHLYWDPDKPLVKLAQVALIKLYMASYSYDSDAPWLFVGDMNTLPENDMYAFLQAGVPTPCWPKLLTMKRHCVAALRFVANYVASQMPLSPGWTLGPLKCTCGSLVDAKECSDSKGKTEAEEGSDDDSDVDVDSSDSDTPVGMVSVPFESAYAVAIGRTLPDGKPVEPPFTTHTHRFFGCIDYIFLQTGRWNVNDVLPLPGFGDINTKKGLPSSDHPSDHLPLLATIQFVGDAGGGGSGK